MPTTALTDDRFSLTRMVTAGGLAAGLALAPRLWLSTRFYPLTPVFSFLNPIPSPWDWIVLAAAIALAVAVMCVPRPRAAIAILMGVLVVLAAGDQSRWQPWFYQYVLMLIAFGLARDRALDICRLIVIFTYFWSGLQKLNPGFIGGLFPWLMEPAVRFSPWLKPALPALAWGAALLEVAAGLGLIWRRTRAAAVLLAIAMHVLVLLELGPTGHNFNRVVWPWNLAMIALDLILFWKVPAFSPVDVLRRGGLYGKLVCLLVVFAPALSFFGFWDEYLSFALYAGNANSATIYMTDSLADRLPDEMQSWIELSDKPGIDQLDVNDWSYAEMDVPSYAQPRIFRNAARVLCRYEKAPGEVTLVVEGRSQWIGRPFHVVSGCASLGR